MLTLGTFFTGTYAYLATGSKKEKSPAPPINASSEDEEKFIKYVGYRFDEQLE